MKFIEVTSLSKIESYNDGVMSSRFEKETELINIDNIALVSNCGNIYLKRGYPNGANVCKTDHTYQEIKDKIDQCTLDHFAGLAMQGFASNPEWAKTCHDDWEDYLKRISGGAYEVADAMLKARKEVKP